MRLKTTWMHFLLLGSVLSVVMAHTGCKGNVDTLIQSDWLYVNKSSHTIKIVSENREPLVLQPEGDHSYSESGLVDGGSVLAPEDYDTPFWWGCTIIVDDTSEHTFGKDEGLAVVKNYESQKIETNHYKFTYTFTDELIAEW